MKIPYALFCLALLLGVHSHAGVIEGRVIAVQDGDTVTLLDHVNVQHRIRLAGIDAPEKSQAFGQRSKQSLGELVFSREVTVNTGKTDVYGRQVGKVVLHGMDVNLEQVKRGLAWHYKAYVREQSHEDRAAYASAEDDAKAANVGLWRDPLPTPPWDFRRRSRSAGVGQKSNE
ncbi:COG1525 Micrococcal nuclease (thermonuclease) homologs [Comamonadaceae bacterium]